MTGYARSTYSSSVWKPPFTRALWARPVRYEEELGLGDEDNGRKCDACGRSNHPPKYIFQFEGKAYHKSTLDEIDPDSDDDDGDNVSVNSNGEELPSKDEKWYIGR